MKLLLRLIVLIVWGTGILYLASCDRPSDDGKDTGTAQNAVNVASGRDSLFTIRLTPQWHHQSQFAGYYVAREKGFYKDYGLDVVIQDGGSDNPAYEALVNGSTDIITLFLLTALNRAEPPFKLVNLAQFSQRSTLMLVGKKSRGITSLESIKGKKVGLWYSDFRELSLEFLNRNNLNPQIIPVDWTNTLFINDAVDLINVMYYNEYHGLLMSGIKEEDLFVVRFSDRGYNIVEDGIYTSRSFYERYPNQCQAFAEASRDGWIYALNHPEETLSIVMRIMKKHHLPTNLSHQRWMLKRIGESVLAKPANLGQLLKEDFEAARKLLLIQNPGLKDLTYEEFYPHAVTGAE